MSTRHQTTHDGQGKISSNPPPPLLILVIGASGDLAKRKTYPALLALSQHQRSWPDATVIYGVARSAKSHESLRQSLRPNLLAKAAPSLVDSFLAKCFYQQTVDYGSPASIRKVLAEASFHNLLFYLAIPPNVFGDACRAIRLAMLTLERNNNSNNIKSFCRIVLEKPFGRDTASCQDLLGTLKLQGWNESCLLRIDHYLGKAAVRMILSVRSQSEWLEGLWNYKAIQSIHILFKEPVGTDGRGGYFDQYGIIRDVMQNHLLQIVSLLAMDLPNATDRHDTDSIRDAKVRLLRSIPAIRPMDCLGLGQYEKYHSDETIRNKTSKCPTYACLVLKIPTKRWEGVPFVLQAGKALDEHICRVRVTLKSGQGSIMFRIQPNPRIWFAPGTNRKQDVEDLCPGLDTKDNDAYAELMRHALDGKHESFVRDDELMEAWRIFTPLLHAIEHQTPILYERGTAGPANTSNALAFQQPVQSSL